MLNLFVILVAVAASYWLYLRRRFPKNFPPHPSYSIPILGDTWNFRNGPTTGIEIMRKKYGKVFGMLVGNVR